MSRWLRGFTAAVAAAVLADPRPAAVDAVVRLPAVLAAQRVLRRRVLQVLNSVHITISACNLWRDRRGKVGGLTAAPGHVSRTRPPTRHKYIQLRQQGQGRQ